MIVCKTEKHADQVKVDFEKNGLSPVMVIESGLFFVCRSYDESMRLMSILQNGVDQRWSSSPKTAAFKRNPQRVIK
jgi:hypothetical protein